MATVLPDMDALEKAYTTRCRFDIEEVCREKGSKALAAHVMRKAIEPMFAGLSEDSGVCNLQAVAAGEVIKNAFHTEEEPLCGEVEVIRHQGGVAIRTCNRVGRNGGSPEEWLGDDRNEWMQLKTAKENGHGMAIVKKVADDVSIVFDGKNAEVWAFFDADGEGRRFPRIVHDK